MKKTYIGHFSFTHYTFKYSIAIFVLVSIFTFTTLAISQETSRAQIVTPVKPSDRQDNASSEIAQFTELKATITKITGSVTIRNRGAFFWHDAKVGEFLKAGDQIVTKADGKIEFKLDNGNTVKLKPQTRLVIKKMTQNNITGDYENFFEVNTGKVWAKIEKLSEKSSFKIKTPTAIAGARGTIIYLVVFPDSTMVLFEEGRGFFTDASLEQTFEVDPGRIYKFDSKGNFSETTQPLPEQLQEITEGWDIDIGTAEGYSPPEEEGGGDDDVEDDVDDTTEDQGDSEEDAETDKTNSQGADKPGYKDTDNDGYLDVNDAFPLNPAEWLDTDSDGTGDNADEDDDGDGRLDVNDAFPLDPNEWLDTDSDGIGDNADTDDDGDGRLDVNDAFPLNPAEWLDTDSDGIGDNADTDDDGDGYLDGEDAFPFDPDEWLDTDSDGVGDNNDAFPNHAARTETRNSMRDKTLALLRSRDPTYADPTYLEEEKVVLRQEIDDMLADIEARHIDSVMEQINDAQTGKVLISRTGHRVRVEQYVLRPNNNTVEVMSLTLHTDPSLEGLHTLDWKTTFNQPLDGLTGEGLRDLHWDAYLEGSVAEDGRIGGGPDYGSAQPEYYPTQMTMKMDNPQGDVFHDRRDFGGLYDAGSSWKQDISEQIYLDGGWRDFKVTTNQTSGGGNPKGFIYNPDDMGREWNVRAKFYVIGDGDTGRVKGMQAVRFDTIWDAIAVNMSGHPNIGENNLEIQLESKFGEGGNKKIDLIYIPWSRQEWNDEHSWPASVDDE